jgi:hypothetical protein
LRIWWNNLKSDERRWLVFRTKYLFPRPVCLPGRRVATPLKTYASPPLCPQVTTAVPLSHCNSFIMRGDSMIFKPSSSPKVPYDICACLPYNVKANIVFKHHSMALLWHEGTVPRILNLCAIYRWLASFTFRPLHRQKSLRYLWAAMLGSARCLTGRFAPARNRNANNRSSSPPPSQYIDTVAPARYDVPT